jgi:hypothetical protein
MSADQATSAMPANGERPVGNVGTLPLLSYLLTILAWEAEAATVLLHLLKKGPLEPFGHIVLLTITCGLTLFTWFRGKRGFERLRWTRGRIRISLGQGIIVALFMVACGSVAAFVADRLFNL